MPTTSDRDTDRDESEEEPFIDTGPMPPGSSRNRTLLWSVVAVLLILSLGAQVIHAQREYLATVPGFGPQLQRVYGALGMDLEPRWDIGALCVESSSGDAATDTLEISSVIAHRGERPQPYPHLQVALTDRWQSIIGRRTIPPGEYLPDGAADGVRFRPGERIDARVRLADPGSAAAGYELHVCYRSAGEGLRCSGGCP